MGIAYKIITELSQKVTYIELCASIMHPEKDGRVASVMTSNGLYPLKEFINNSSENEILNKGPYLLNLIEPIYQTSLKSFPPKKTLGEIKTAIQRLTKENPGYKNTGYIYGWLFDLIDCSRLYKELIPFHGKVGCFMHAGRFAIEESIILRDAFFFMVKAEFELEILNKMAEQQKNSKIRNEEQYTKAMIHNLNVGTYSRSALINFYSFIEAFINGIGLDHIYRNREVLTENEQEILTGRKNNSYMSLEKRMEVFPQLIRADKKQIIFIKDLNQIVDPFKTFFDEYKGIRDSSVHFSALKEPIVRKPHEWVEKISMYSKVCLDVAKKFWAACFETTKFPDYLDILDHDTLKKLAIERIKISSQ